MKASETFRHPVYRHNCAQAIAAKWKDLYACDDIVEKYASLTGGRAEGGLCGALYAAMQAMPDHAEEIKDAFQSEAKYLTCRELKTQGRVPCTRCVDLADEILEKLSQK